MARLFASASSQSLTASSAPLSATPISMACWFRPATVATDMTLMEIAFDANNFWQLLFQGSVAGAIFANHYDGFDFQDANTSTGITVANAWHHAAVVYSSASARSAYVDGGSKGSSSGTSVTPTAPVNCTVGASTAGASGYTNGRIAEAAVWNVGLTDGEVLSLSQGVMPYRVRRSALVAYWPLFGSASPEPDLSGHARNLTLVNAPAAANHAPVTLWTPKAPLFAPIGTGGGGFTTVFRRQLSPIGTRIGSRQMQAS